MGVGVRHAGDDHSAAFRIPGLVTTNKGTLLGVYDVRYNSSVDLQEHVDVGLSRSTDGGKTWEKMRLPLAFGEHGGLPAAQNGVGDPSILVYVFPLIVAVQYKEKNVLWLSYALEVFLLPVSMIVGFYYGICDLNLLLQGNHTRTWYLSELADGFARIPFSKMPVVVIIVYRILPQLLILFVFVMIIQHTIGSMREDAYRIAELTYRKEVDSATRLYNKNKYEDMLANYYTMVERVAVVLWDINNLKEINDRMGHGMGDKLIETMSGAIYAQTDSRKKAYRIGGDEFVMLIENPEKQEAEQIIQNVRDKLARHREEGGLRVSSATGTAEGNGIDILKIVHDADERMYEDKKRGKESREYAMFYSE